MDKNKIKKYIIILSIFLIVLIMLIIFSKIYFKSKKYIVSLLKKGDNNINYSISYNDGELKNYVKENEEKLIFSDGKIYYANYETGESIFIDPNEKIIKLDTVETKDNPHSNLYIKDIDYMSYEYENIKKVNSNDCVVIKLYDNKNNNAQYLMKKIYINKKLGVIEKIEKYSSTVYGEDTLISKKIYKMHTDDVSNEDVEKPDLKKYTDYEIINNR